MKRAKILALILSAALCLSACGGGEEVASSEQSPSNNSSSEIVSSEPQNTLVPDITASETYGDLLSKIEPHGRELRVYGELAGAQYSPAVSSLESVLSAYNRNVSVVAYSLDGKRALSYNTSAEIFCACAVKAPYTLYCLREMEKGKATLETKMEYKKEHYEPGTGDMQYSPYGTIFDMKTMLHKSMSISDNVGYMMAVDYFGRDGYNEWIGSIGLDSLKIKPTVWSLRAKARDLAAAWREIYEYFRDGGEYAEFLYDSCTNTAGNYMTEKLDCDYSHKQGHNRSGDWTSYTDAGIIWKEGNPYILVILTDAPGPSSYDSEVFGKVSNIIYNELF